MYSDLYTIHINAIIPRPHQPGFFYYSVLKASIGLNVDALTAG